MKSFIGTYECKIDDKGRIKIPLSFAKQLEDLANEEFIIKRSVFHDCLEIYPLEKWDGLMKKINGLNRFIKKNTDFIRVFTAGVKTVSLDNTGRIQISKELCNFAKLKKETVLTSAGELFEIWDKESYERFMSDNQNNFSDLAQEIMGSVNFEE